MEVKLYNVSAFVSVDLEVEACSAEEAENKAKEHLVDRGVYDLSCSVGFTVDSVEEVREVL